MTRIEFQTCDKGEWLRTLCGAYEKFTSPSDDQKISIGFVPEIQKDSFKPFHLVTYACLVHELIGRGFEVSQDFDGNRQCSDFIFSEIGLKYYWTGINHVEINDSNILNIWRVVESELDVFSGKVTEYFKTRYFQNKDLSAISNSIVEAFYNIYDHADARGNAFCLVRYYEDRGELSVAISDFGRGLVNTVKEFDGSIKDDCAAMERAIDPQFTIASTTHNRGFGLDNILSSADVVRIVSGEAFLYKTGDKRQIFKLNMSFPGTLIFFDIDLSNLDDIDILDQFNF